MRYAALLLVFLPPVALFVACGGDDATSPDDGGHDGTTKDSSGNDSAGDAGGNADSTADAFDTSIPDVFGALDVAVTCTDPSTCEAGTPLCCATIVTGPGSPPFCPLNNYSTVCASTCTTNLVLSCSSTETVRVCAKTSDCTENGYPNCCTFAYGSQNITFCASDLIAPYGSCFDGGISDAGDGGG